MLAYQRIMYRERILREPPREVRVRWKRIGKAVHYYGSLASGFARRQKWERYDLAITADKELQYISRVPGLRVLSTTHGCDPNLSFKLGTPYNDGIMFDGARASTLDITRLKRALLPEKILAINTGWGSNPRIDYGCADMVMVESFIGSHNDDGRYPVDYFVRPPELDMEKVLALKTFGYKVIALTYGPSEDWLFCEKCLELAARCGADYFIYTQPPGWEMPGSGYRFWAG